MTTMFINILDPDVVMFAISILLVVSFLVFMLVRSTYRLDMYARGWYDSQYARIEKKCEREFSSGTVLVYVDWNEAEKKMLDQYVEN